MNYFNYFTEIEEEFVKRRGSHMLVSPLDWALMETWMQRGVPLYIVLRGINSSFDSYDQRARRGRRVNSLLYCQQEIEAMFLEYCESRIGSNGASSPGGGESANGGQPSEASSSSKAIIDYLAEHLAALNELSGKYENDPVLGETFSRTALRLETILDDLRQSVNFSTEELEMDLSMIEEVILDGLRESAGEQSVNQIRKEGKRQLQAYRDTMEREIFDQTLDNFIARKLREQYRVPRLSLFYL